MYRFLLVTLFFLILLARYTYSARFCHDNALVNIVNKYSTVVCLVNIMLKGMLCCHMYMHINESFHCCRSSHRNFINATKGKLNQYQSITHYKGINLLGNLPNAVVCFHKLAHLK